MSAIAKSSLAGAIVGASVMGMYCLHKQNLQARKFNHLLRNSNDEKAQITALNEQNEQKVMVLTAENRSLLVDNNRLKQRTESLLDALTTVSSTSGVMSRELQQRTFERDQALVHLRDEREEKNRIAAEVLEIQVQKEQAEEAVRESLSHRNESLEEIDALNRACQQLREDVYHSQSENEHLKVLVAEKTNCLLQQLGTIGELRNRMAEGESRIEWLENALKSETERVRESQRALEACERFLDQVDLENQARLLRCFEEIHALRGKISDMCREVNEFLSSHPQLDIEISLTLRKERAMCTSPASTSSEEESPPHSSPSLLLPSPSPSPSSFHSRSSSFSLE
ncbi:centromere protein F [Gracilaria domingensis]|nr:centromere protein F [Gracilaria domingensis]